jgi:hypothetical protein
MQVADSPQGAPPRTGTHEGFAATCQAPQPRSPRERAGRTVTPPRRTEPGDRDESGGDLAGRWKVGATCSRRAARLRAARLGREGSGAGGSPIGGAVPQLRARDRLVAGAVGAHHEDVGVVVDATGAAVASTLPQSSPLVCQPMSWHEPAVRTRPRSGSRTGHIRRSLAQPTGRDQRLAVRPRGGPHLRFVAGSGGCCHAPHRSARVAAVTVRPLA